MELQSHPAALFLLLKLLLKKYLGDTVPFVLFFSAVMISAWFGGLGPGIVATALSTLFAAMFFMGTAQKAGYWNEALPLITFAVEGLGISVLSHSRRRVLQDRTLVLERERTAREHAEQVGQKLNKAIESITAETAHRKRSEESLRVSEERNVTESQRAVEERLRLSSEVERQARIFDTTLSSITDFAYILDREARFRYVNKALLDLWGLRLDQAIGKNFFDLGYPHDLAAKLANQVRQVFETRTGLSDETPYTSPTGAGGTYEYIFSPVLAADGSVEVVAGSTRDVTEYKRTEETLRQIAAEREQLLSSERAARGEAERAGRIKDEFLATLSHELRTPLNAILGWSQILAIVPRREEDLNEGLASIDRNARAQTQIIEDLLDMSRIISGKVRFEVQIVDLGPIVRAAVDTLKPAADARGVQLQLDLDPNVATVVADPGRLHQIFWNLLSNAVKFTPRGGCVRSAARTARFTVPREHHGYRRGNPARIPPLCIRSIPAIRCFDDTPPRRARPGTGDRQTTGRTTRRQRPRHQRRRRPGRHVHRLASVFDEPSTGRATRLDSVPNSEAATSAPKARADIAGMRVLVVDDEPDARALMKRLLEEYDAVVTVAASATEALQCLEADPPDVLASDIGMPGMDGYELIRRVRALGPTRGGDTPALALTAYAHAADRARTVSAGFQRHVAKPIDPAELIAAIAGLGRQKTGVDPVRPS